MTEDHLGWVEISRHLQQMRVTTGLFLATVPAAIAVAFLAPYRGSSVASPLTVTLTAAAASLWIGFAANRDAGNRLEKIRRAFAVHGDESRLLRDHWLVYLAVLVRLEMMVVCGLIRGRCGTTFEGWNVQVLNDMADHSRGKCPKVKAVQPFLRFSVQ